MQKLVSLLVFLGRKFLIPYGKHWELQNVQLGVEEDMRKQPKGEM